MDGWRRGVWCFKSWRSRGGGLTRRWVINRTSLVYALQNWLSESPDQATRKPGSNPGILGVAMGLMAVFIVCILSPCLPPQPTSDSYFFSSQVPGTFSAPPFAGVTSPSIFFGCLWHGWYKGGESLSRTIYLYSYLLCRKPKLELQPRRGRFRVCSDGGNGEGEGRREGGGGIGYESGGGERRGWYDGGGVSSKERIFAPGEMRLCGRKCPWDWGLTRVCNYVPAWEQRERESRYILKGKAGIMSKSFFPPIYIYIFSLICSVLYATLSSVRRRPLSSSSSSAAAGITYGNNEMKIGYCISVPR